jgi:hypothetical protein
MAAGAGYMAGKHRERGREADAGRDARLDDLEQQHRRSSHREVSRTLRSDS